MDGTRTSHYDFDLPVDLIAQQPTERRGDSRLMVVNRATGEIAHRAFEAADAQRYQTVYAMESGSVAAPTAGLHFTPEILDSLAAKGVKRADVILHVGAGTFKPVETEHPADHVMHEESYILPAATAVVLNDTRSKGGKIGAVGTTSVRTLKSAVGEDGMFREKSTDTRIFIPAP